MKVDSTQADSPHVEYVSFVKFQIVSGKKHQIRAHASQVLKTPILFDTKYGFQKEESFSSQPLKKLLFGEKLVAQLQKAALKEVEKHTGKPDPGHLLSRVYGSSLKENGTLCLHAYKLVCTFPDADGPTHIEARFSLQLRTVFSILHVD